MAQGTPGNRPKGRNYEKLVASLARQEEQRAMIALVEDIADEFVEREQAWLQTVGIDVDFDEGWIEFRKGEGLFMIEAGPNMTVLINGKAEHPEPSFFTPDYYNNLKRRMMSWATKV